MFIRNFSRSLDCYLKLYIIKNLNTLNWYNFQQISFFIASMTYIISPHFISQQSTIFITHEGREK